EARHATGRSRARLGDQMGSLRVPRRLFDPRARVEGRSLTYLRGDYVIVVWPVRSELKIARVVSHVPLICLRRMMMALPVSLSGAFAPGGVVVRLKVSRA